MKYRIVEVVRSDKSIFVAQESTLGWFWTDCEDVLENLKQFDTLDEARSWVKCQQSPEVFRTIIHEVG